MGAMTLALLSACGQDLREANAGLAREVLKGAGAGTEFVDASTAKQAAVRHAPSGLVCVLPREGAFDMGQFPTDAANPGAYCSHSQKGLTTTLISVKFRQPTTLDAAFADGLSTALSSKQAKIWSGRPSAADLAPAKGLPHYRIARYEVIVDGKPSYLRIAMSERNGWYYQQFSVGEIGSAAVVEGQAGAAWRALLHEIASTPSQTRTGAVH